MEITFYHHTKKVTVANHRYDLMISHLDYFCILSFLRFLSKTKLPLALKISVGEERESTYSKEEWLYRKIAISRFCNPILHLICIISGTQMIHHLNSSATIYTVPRTRSWNTTTPNPWTEFSLLLWTQSFQISQTQCGTFQLIASSYMHTSTNLFQESFKSSRKENLPTQNKNDCIEKLQWVDSGTWHCSKKGQLDQLIYKKKKNNNNNKKSQTRGRLTPSPSQDLLKIIWSPLQNFA